MYNYHHPNARRFLDLPIYRCNNAQHSKEISARFESAFRTFNERIAGCPPAKKTGETLEENQETWFRTRWFQSNGYIWDFNEIVGWIRLYTWPENIGAYLFFVQQRVTQIMVRKKYECKHGKLFELPIFRDQCNATIFENLKAAIDKGARRAGLKRFYIDIGVLEVLGPHMDWVVLTGRR